MLRAMSVWVSAIVVSLALSALAPQTLAANPDTSVCGSLRARYQSGFADLVSQVRAKNPMLLVAYASKLGGVHASRVPSQATALDALNSVKPACLQSLGATECNRLLGSARSFIGQSTALNRQFEAKGCPGSLAD